MSAPTELSRRQRLFRWGFAVLCVAELAPFVALLLDTGVYAT